MTAKKQVLISIFLFSASAVLAIVLFMFAEAKNAEFRRECYIDAMVIRDALVLYMKQHNGSLSTSISKLKLQRADIDTSPFKLLPPGARPRRENQDAIAQVENVGKERNKIIIYADGTIDYE